MALIRTGGGSATSGLQANSYVPLNNTGYQNLATYTDNTAINIAASTYVSGLIAGVTGKSSFTSSIGGYYTLIKKDGTVVTGTATANTAISLTDAVEIAFIEISSAAVAAYTVTIA